VKLVAALALVCGFSAFGLDNYQVDPGHSSVVFKINHLGFSNVYGMFGDVSGTFSVDDSNPAANKVSLLMKTDSITTMNAKRDEHLKKPDFFDAKQFPTVEFKSTSVKKGSGGTLDVTGNLTMHGVTKPVSFKLTRSRTGMDPMNKQRTGGDAMFTVKRSDFGMNFMSGPNMVGDEVTIMVSLEGTKQ
jgi:polyisoprenoid-binding protein YceI